MSGYRPREVFCVIDQMHRDVGRARQVEAGEFELAGECIHLGTVPDWLHGNFPVDEEWRIELSKFYYGLDLAHAFEQCGDEAFSTCWRNLVLSWIEQVPVDHDPTDVAARRIQNWTYAWVRFTEAGWDDPFDDVTAERILASLRDQLRYVRENLAGERNHRTLELYALLIGALAFPRIDPDREMARFAAFELDRNLRADLLADGVHRELSTHYHAIALRSFVGTRVNADRFRIELAADYDHRLGAACDFLAYVLRPDGSLPMLSDSDDGDHLGLLEVAAEELRRPDLAWVASQGKYGTPPADTNRAFPLGGYHVQRSGWAGDDADFENERQLIFDCGPVGDSGHGHYDALHVEVYAYGRPLLVDPGRSTYSERGDTNWRHWFKGTAAHNTVCVDGLDQVAYRRGKQKGPTSHTRLLENRDRHGVASLIGEVVSPEYDAIHRRRVLFVQGSWWVIEDTIRAHDSHRYDLRFHLPADATGRVQCDGSRVVAPGIRLLLVDPPAEPRLEDGWISKQYGVRESAPTISIAAPGTNMRFLTVVIPDAGGEPMPEILSSGLEHVEIERSGRRDRVTWGRELLGCETWE